MTEQSMVERVARAIAQAVADQSDSGVTPKWSDFRDEARAAITAMRKPSDAMVDVAREMVGSVLEESPVGPVAKEIFPAMIDAALKEQPE